MNRTALLFFLLCMQQANPTTFTVTNTADSGAGSLRQAITDANADTSPPTIINFNIPPGGPQTIVPTSFFFIGPGSSSQVYPPFAQTITLDATTQPGFTPTNPQIDIDCSVIAATGRNGSCFSIIGVDNCVIKGLIIHRYVGGASGRGVIIRNTSSHGASGNQITQCRIGAFTGFGNTRGIVMDGSASATFPVANNIIGGPSATDANVLSGNSISGLAIQFNVNSTTIQNNYFGCDKTGSIALGNAYGVVMIGDTGFACDGNTITDNVIAGNSTFGIVLQTEVNNTLVQNNTIGTNKTGTAALGNAIIGVLINGDATHPCVDNVIDNNLISGFTQGGNGAGIYLTDNVNNTSITGNFIGTDSTGLAAIPNSFGIIIFNDPGTTCTGNTIGGASASARNLISGNTFTGTFFQNNVLNNSIQNNYVGVDATGTAPLPNLAGIQLIGDTGQPVDNNTITGNVISANGNEGIGLYDNTNNNLITGNVIGTDQTTTLNLGNGASGILIQGSTNLPSTRNTIGGTATGEKNIIKFNGATSSPGYGVYLNGDPTTPDILNDILGNSIYLNDNNGIELTNNGNNLQEGPTLTQAFLCSNSQQLRIIGTAPADPAASNFRLEFFVNNVDRSPITEGERFVGDIPSIASGAPFNVLLSVTSPSVTPGTWVSATATNLNNGGNPGDTSEFTPNLQIQDYPPVAVSITTCLTTINEGDSLTLTATLVGTAPFTLTWSDGVVQAGVTSPATRTVSPTSTTTYTVTVTDANQCQAASNSITITVIPGKTSALSAAIRNKYCPLC